jgi:trigger factor
VKVSQDEIVDRQATLNIEADAESLEEHMGKAYRSLVGRVNIPGFRKGKAPRQVFERAFGRERLIEEALETIVPEVVQEAITETAIDAGGTPRVEVIEREPVLKIKAVVPLTPMVTLGEYQTISFDEKPDPITDEQIAEALGRIQEGNATWEPKDGSVEIDDMAVLQTLRATADGTEFISSENTEYVVFAEATYPIPGFATEVIGMKAGEAREFSLIVPDDYPNPDAAGKTAVFSVAVSEVKKKNLPALDDEFAADVGDGFESIDALRARVQEDLEAQANDFFTRQIEDRAVDAVVAMSQIEIPPITIEHESEHVLSEQQQQLSQFNMSLQDYMSGLGKTPDEFVQDARETARTRLTRALVVEELARAESIEVSDEDLRAEIDRLKQSATSPADRAAYETDRARDSIQTMLRRRSTLGRLVELVTPAPSQENGAASKAVPAAKPVKAKSPRKKKAPTTARKRTAKPGT